MGSNDGPRCARVHVLVVVHVRLGIVATRLRKWLALLEVGVHLGIKRVLVGLEAIRGHENSGD